MKLRNRHNHAGGAVAALQSVIVPEGFLDRGEFAVLGQALDGGNVGAVGLHCKRGAGLHGIAVHLDYAGAALAGVAADFGAGEVQGLAQEVNQQRAGFHLGGTGTAIHGQRDGYFVRQNNTSSGQESREYPAAAGVR